MELTRGSPCGASPPALRPFSTCVEAEGCGHCKGRCTRLSPPLLTRCLPYEDNSVPLHSSARREKMIQVLLHTLKHRSISKHTTHIRPNSQQTKDSACQLSLLWHRNSKQRQVDRIFWGFFFFQGTGTVRNIWQTHCGPDYHAFDAWTEVFQLQQTALRLTDFCVITWSGSSTLMLTPCLPRQSTR